MERRNVWLVCVWCMAVLSPVLSIGVEEAIRAVDPGFYLEPYLPTLPHLVGVLVICFICILFLRLPAHVRALLYVATIFLLLAQLIAPFIIWPGLTQD